MNVIEMLNTIRDQGSQMYQDRIPSATLQNMSDIGVALTDYEPAMNEFLDSLVNRIALTVVRNKLFHNPLSILKKGKKPYGTDIEEIMTNPTLATTFTDADATDMMTQAKPDTKTIFHRMNRRDKYKITISVERLQKAFLSAGELEKFVNSIINAMYSGDNIDEFLLMKGLVSSAITDDKIVTLEVDYDGGETTSKELIKAIKTLAINFTFPSTAYNGYNVLNATAITGGSLTASTTWCDADSEVILIRSDVDASTDVEVLAKAFNMDKTNFMQRKIVVDSFDDANVLMVICDEAALQVYDDLYQVRRFENGSGLYTNYWLHHWQTISLSLFANAVAVKQTVTPTP